MDDFVAGLVSAILLGTIAVFVIGIERFGRCLWKKSDSVVDSQRRDMD
jgi:hypothetical protein